MAYENVEKLIAQNNDQCKRKGNTAEDHRIGRERIQNGIYIFKKINTKKNKQKKNSKLILNAIA